MKQRYEPVEKKVIIKDNETGQYLDPEAMANALNEANEKIETLEFSQMKTIQAFENLQREVAEYEDLEKRLREKIGKLEKIIIAHENREASIQEALNNARPKTNN